MSKTIPDTSATASDALGEPVRCDIIESRLGLEKLDDEDLQALILQWLGAGQAQYEQHPLTVEFSRQLEILATSEPLAKSAFPAYRGRYFPPRYRPSPQDFGPPPPGSGKSGRYNEPDMPTLYLCLRPEGVQAELQCRHDHAGDWLWLQTFRVPAERLRLADFRPRCVRLFNLVFDYCEHCEEPLYQECRRIGKLVMKAGFDGMIVPSLRCREQLDLANLVIFQSHEREWDAWITGGPWLANNPDGV